MAIEYEILDLSRMFPGRKDAFAIVVDNLFSKEECSHLIELSNAKGYDEALVGGSQVRRIEQRNNFRCIIDDPLLAAKIFLKVRPFVPPEWLGYKVSMLNERLRFLRYGPGEYFKPHNDGIFVRDDKSQASFVTIHLYLTDVPEGHGGETTFTSEKMTYGRHKFRSRSGEEEHVERLSVRPVTGRVLIFEHHLPHEGSTLLHGVKYTVRTDVMYDLAGEEPLRTPRWGLGKAFPHPQYVKPSLSYL
jgi:hypothetical protein